MFHKKKKNREVFEILSKEYQDTFQPLILPKIAKHCFDIKGSPVAVAFAAKIKLYDLNALKKENMLVRKFKNKKTAFSSHVFRINTARNQNTLNFLSPQHKKSRSNVRNPQISNLNRTQTEQDVNEKQHRYSFSKIKELPINNKAQWDKIISQYQQLHELIRILTQRLSDLQDFICVIKELNAETETFQKHEAQIDKLIFQAKIQVQQILPSDMFQKVFDNSDSKNQKCKWLVRRSKNMQTEGSASFRKTRFENKKTQGQQSEDGESKIKFNFLKRSPNEKAKPKNLKFKVPPKISLKKFIKSFYSTKPDKSFALNKKNFDQKSKNTHEKLSEYLEQMHQENLFHLSDRFLNPKSRKMSVKGTKQDLEIYKEAQKKKAKSWDNIMMGTDKIIASPPVQSKPKNPVNESRRQSKKVQSPVNSNRPSINLKQTKRISTEIRNKSNRPSQTLNTDNRSERKSQLIGSRSSLSSSTNSKSTLQRFRKSGLRTSEIHYDDQKAIAKRQLLRKKVRVGQMKKQVINFSQDETNQISLKEIEDSVEGGPQKHVKGRRKGKALPISMNGMFQRILHDDKIEKIVHANNERESQNILKRKTSEVTGKAQQSILKRIKRSIENENGAASSTDWVEDYYKNVFRIQRPKDEFCLQEKENYRINYSDIIQLQKCLRPIASYNESKMITRYSTQKAEVELSNFQFKYKNNKFVFNHEFYLRKQEEHRKDADVEYRRQKSARDEHRRIDFMAGLKKGFQRTGQPIQKGFDQDEDENDSLWG